MICDTCVRDTEYITLFFVIFSKYIILYAIIWVYILYLPVTSTTVLCLIGEILILIFLFVENAEKMTFHFNLFSFFFFLHVATATVSRKVVTCIK